MIIVDGGPKSGSGTIVSYSAMVKVKLNEIQPYFSRSSYTSLANLTCSKDIIQQRYPGDIAAVI